MSYSQGSVVGVIKKCPRTGAAMRPITVDGITVDVSEGCGGVWFDRFELDKFDDAQEEHGAVLLAMIAPFECEIDTRARLQSPVVPDCVMMRRHFAPSDGAHVTIDECPATGGIWLDPGELEKVRLLFRDPEHKQAASERFMSDLKVTFDEEADDQPKKSNRWMGVLNWLTGAHRHDAA